jgi:3-oxoacyl-[acyl-carrier protein] reductase
LKTIMVTGGNRGLGLAITKRLLQDSYRIVVVARTSTEAIEKLIKETGGLVSFEPFDFSETEGIHTFVRQLCARHGHFWGLVNNAAIGLDAVLATQHEADIEALVRINLIAPILLTKSLCRPMLLAGKGRIVNISSIIANTGFSGLSVYGATKAGLVGFTKSLARELGKAGITVNAVCPGYMQTEMTQSLQGEKLQSIMRRSPLGRLASVDDVAGAVSYLLGPDGASVTGTTLTIDAGSTI